MKIDIRDLKGVCIDLELNFTEINYICDEKDRASKIEIKAQTQQGIKTVRALCTDLSRLQSQQALEIRKKDLKLSCLKQFMREYNEGVYYIDDLLKNIERLIDAK